VVEEMKEMEVQGLLDRLNKINKDVERVNQVAVQNKGFKKAQIEQIQALAKELNNQGIQLSIDVDDKGRITEASRKEFVDVFTNEYKLKLEQAAKTELLLDAIERKDYALIQKLTGEDVREESYDLEISTVKELMAKENEEIAKLKDEMSDGSVVVGDSQVVATKEEPETKVVQEATVVNESKVEHTVTEGVVKEDLADNVVNVEFTQGTTTLEEPVKEKSTVSPMDKVRSEAEATIGNLFDGEFNEDFESVDFTIDEEEVSSVDVVEEDSNGGGLQMDFTWGDEDIQDSDALDGLSTVNDFFSGMKID
jgi:hypothetical protein